MSRKCAIKCKNFYFFSYLQSFKGRKMRFLSESCKLNSLFISRNSKQQIRKYYIIYITLHLTYFDSSLPKDTLCQVLLKSAMWIFKSCQYIFTMWPLSPLGKMYGPSFKLFEVPLPQKISFKIQLKFAQRFLRRKFSKVLCIILRCCYYLPLENWQIPTFDLN